MFFKVIDLECVVHSRSDNKELMINDKVNKVIEEPFSGYQTGLKASMNSSDFI